MDESKEIVEEVIDAVIEKKAKEPIEVKKPTLPQKPKEEPIVVEKKKEPVKKEEPVKVKKELRGRPKGSSDNKPTKIKLKPTPKSAVQAFKEDFKGLDIVAIYGVDEFTDKLIRELWSDPNKEFVITDPVDQRAGTLTRSIGSLPYSMYRYNQIRPQGFVEEGLFPVVIVAEEYWEMVMKLPNPNKVIFTCLSHWGK
jgi:hypothetical protein